VPSVSTMEGTSDTTAVGQMASQIIKSTVSTDVALTDLPGSMIVVSDLVSTAVANTDTAITVCIFAEPKSASSAVVCREQILTPPSVVLATGQVAARGNIAVPAVTAQPLAVERWGRDALMVEGIFRIIESMEPPWITLNVLEAAALQFPTVNREVLRHTIMTILLSQRRCVVRLPRAGLRLGPRTDREGNAFVELDLDYANRYSNSH